MKSLILSVSFAVAFVSSASAGTIISDAKKIQSIVARIPVIDRDLAYKNLAERLPKVGFKVEYVMVTKIGRAEAEPPYFLAGDEIIDISMNEANEVVQAICPISGVTASYLIRGKKIIPQSRTAYWLMTNRCDYKG